MTLDFMVGRGGGGGSQWPQKIGHCRVGRGVKNSGKLSDVIYGRSLSGTRETWFLSWPGITEFCHIDGFSLETLFSLWFKFFLHPIFLGWIILIRILSVFDNLILILVTGKLVGSSKWLEDFLHCHTFQRANPCISADTQLIFITNWNLAG